MTQLRYAPAREEDIPAIFAQARAVVDAYEDVEKDVEKGNYNPFSEDYIMEGFQERVQNILIMMMSEACREFEKLPIIKYADILRNILYSGVWCRFEAVSKKRKEEREKK